ncbi:TetR/AcrR family transcriptional regulator [Spongorhabdus nitratireducens]
MVASDKRSQLLETALQLFYEKGINAVGINEVLKSSGIAKKTLYNHFSSKDELVLASLQLRDQRFLAWIESKIEKAVDNKQVVIQLFKALTDWFNNRAPELPPFRGCFFINSAIEYGVTNDEVAAYCRQHKQQFRQILAARLTDIPEGILDTLCTLKEGAIVMAQVSGDTMAAEKCLPAALKLLNKD